MTKLCAISQVSNALVLQLLDIRQFNLIFNQVKKSQPRENESSSSSLKLKLLALII